MTSIKNQRLKVRGGNSGRKSKNKKGQEKMKSREHGQRNGRKSSDSKRGRKLCVLKTQAEEKGSEKKMMKNCKSRQKKERRGDARKGGAGPTDRHKSEEAGGPLQGNGKGEADRNYVKKSWKKNLDRLKRYLAKQ